MADWQEEDQDQWPVKYPVEGRSQTAKGRYQRSPAPRWTGAGKDDTTDLRKRLLWSLLAVEIGMALAAACVLPMAFLNLPPGEKGIAGTVLTKAGEWACLVLVLSILIILFTLGLNLWLYRWLQQSAKSRKDSAQR